MRLLLDSHALIWAVDDYRRLGTDAHDAISDAGNELVLSAAVIWEIAIKVGLGKLSLTMAYREWMRQAIDDLGATILPITVEYADVQSGLPTHHGDPFDRLLVAQAITEQIAVVSNDAAFDAYGVQRVW